MNAPGRQACSESGSIPTEGIQPIDDFELYKLLVDLVKHDHNRWVDNFKVMLTLNTVLLGAISTTATFAARLPHSSLLYWLPLPLLLSAVGIVTVWAGYLVIKRIYLNADLRYGEIRDLEKVMRDHGRLSITPFLSGREYFFGTGVQWWSFSRGLGGIQFYKIISFLFTLVYIYIAL